MLAGEHISVPLRCRSQYEAQERCELLTALGRKLLDAGHADKAKTMLGEVARSDGDALDELIATVDALCSGEIEVSGASHRGTFGWLAERWTSGDLAREYRDHVKAIDHRANISYLKTHILPHLRDTSLAAFTEQHGALVMSKLPADLEVATRRHVAQIMSRLMNIAVFPMRIIKTNPLPKGWLPPLSQGGKAKGYLYPDEDAVLLACPHVPFAWRLFYGFLHREGCRRSEAIRMSFIDFDLDRGGVRLDVNKTNDPRFWALASGTTEAIRRWQEIRAPKSLLDPVFVDEDGLPMGKLERHFAQRFRRHLEKAGIKRAELFERSEHRQPIRLHDTRATFITVSLALGKSESWVQTRTGHKSSLMINKYRRAAMTMQELRLTMREFLPLDQAIPELRDAMGRRLRVVK